MDARTPAVAGTVRLPPHDSDANVKDHLSTESVLTAAGESANGSPESLLRLRISPIRSKLVRRNSDVGANSDSAAGSDSETASSSNSESRTRNISMVPPLPLRIVGKLASVACGATELSHLLRENLPEDHWAVQGIRGIPPIVEDCLDFSIKIALRIIFGLMSLVLAIVVVPALIWDSMHLGYFWASSIATSHQEFLEEGEKILGVIKDRNDKFQRMKFVNDQALKPSFEGSTFISEWGFVLWFISLDLIRNMTMYKLECKDKNRISIKNIRMMMKERMSKFRQYLSYREPDFPISANDDVYRYDREGNRFQLLMLFIMDRVDFEEFKHTYQRRWIDWETKTRAVVGRRYGRPAWRVIRHEEFDANNHITFKSVNLTSKTITDVVSELAEEEMPPDRPQWQVWFVQPEETSEAFKMSLCGNKPISELCFICCKWNHIYSDGAGMMMSIVKRIGDFPVSVEALPENYRRVVPKWQQYAYYGFHSLRAAFECSQHLLYFLYGIPSYPAIMVPNSNADRRAPPSPNTGRKHYSAPAVMSITKMGKLRKAIGEIGKDIVTTDANPLLHFLRRKEEIRSLRQMPTINDLLCYCLANAFAQVRNPQRMGYLLREVLGVLDESRIENSEGADEGLSPSGKLRLLERNKSLFDRQGDQEYLNVIVPMMCRVSIPTRMDNFTSLVSTRLPLPAPKWQVSKKRDERQETVLRVNTIKAVLDQMKIQNCRTTLFLIFSAICKACPSRWTERFYFEVYRHMQFCSTNVAAPSIDSTFCGKKVIGLFFWPAVPVASTGGSAWVSLGNEMQVLTVLDESELRAANQEAISIVENLYPGLCVGTEAQTQLIEELADLLPKLVLKEFNRLCQIFDVQETTTEKAAQEETTTTRAASTTDAIMEQEDDSNNLPGTPTPQDIGSKNITEVSRQTSAEQVSLDA